jgi:hypothetical protein
MRVMGSAREVCMSQVKVAALLTVAALGAGCATQNKSAPASTGANPDIASEVSRICALPPAEREQALEKLKKESGMVLFCGSKE